MLDCKFPPTKNVFYILLSSRVENGWLLDYLSYETLNNSHCQVTNYAYVWSIDKSKLLLASMNKALSDGYSPMILRVLISKVAIESFTPLIFWHDTGFPSASFIEK